MYELVLFTVDCALVSAIAIGLIATSVVGVFVAETLRIFPVVREVSEIETPFVVVASDVIAAVPDVWVKPVIFDKVPVAESLCVPPVAKLPELSTTNLSAAETWSWRRFPPAVSLIKMEGLADVSASALDGAKETNPFAPPDPLVQVANCCDAFKQT